MTNQTIKITLASLALAGVSACSTGENLQSSVSTSAVAMAEAAQTSSQLLNAPVATQNGLVQGTAGKLDGVTVFKGLPFAAPPVGDLRWEMPQPAANWDGVRQADAWGNNCIQGPAPQRFPVNSATDMPDSPDMSEDCLYLNVWTPAKTDAENLPVMVWLFGGAYSEGGGSAPFSQGDQLAQKGVIVITLNYRVGSLGFFSHPELTAASSTGASGNQAMGDAIAALQWVKDNISNFGGDPSRVTIFGESAGAAMNAGLTGAPPANGLFQRTISQSGGYMGLGIAQMVGRQGAEASAVEQAEKAGASSLAQLRAMPAQDVYAKIRGAGMIIDGHVIPEDLSVTFAQGRQNKVDALVGSNQDEGSFALAFGPPPSLATWQQGEAMRWGEHVQMGRGAYPVSTDAEAIAAAPQPFSDALAWNMWQFAALQAPVSDNVYLYYFTHDPLYDADKSDLGAAHTGEIPYVFDNLAAPRTFPGGSSVELMSGNPREEAFSDQVSQYWVNFAATGNPNGANPSQEVRPHWPAFSELENNEVMVLDADGSGKGPYFGLAKMRLYQTLFNDRVGTPLNIAE